MFSTAKIHVSNIGKKYTQKGNCTTSVPISTFIHISVRDFYIAKIGLSICPAAK
jgi:hypothetical protein